MAEKRMFTMKIIDSDAFLDLPLSTQALYFHLNMRADDDGFVKNPKRIQRLVGGSEDDLRLLLAKRFILGFDSGVIVIKHWRMHNLLRKDRYHPTPYQDEYQELAVKDNGSYTWQPDGNQMATEERLRIGEVKDSKEKYGEFQNVALTPDEKEELLQRIGEPEFNKYVEDLDLYIAQKGKKYKSHYATILNWYRRDHEGKHEEALPVYSTANNPKVDEERMKELVNRR